MTTKPTNRLPTHRRLNQFRAQLLSWYSVNGRKFPWRRKCSTRYHLILSEILLKRTRADGAAGFFHSFVSRYPSWTVLAQASTDELESVLRPIGLWRQRASSLAALATEMVRRNGRFPQDRESIENLPGVGQYVANAILLFCHSGREPLLDAGMARVLERCFGERKLVDIRYDPWLQSLAKRAVECEYPVPVNWALLDLAALVCHAGRPDCPACPVRKYCKSANIFIRASLR